MKTNIQRNLDAGNGGGANNAGSSIDGLGVGDDKDLNNGTTKLDATGGQGATGQQDSVTETPEAKLARETAEGIAKTNEETAKKFGGVKLDDKGNAVDAEGKIVKTADEIKAGGTTTADNATAVTIDDVTYKLDDKGNAIDKDGKVFKTKVELDALTASQEIPLVDEILQKSGLTILDDKGQPKKYEDTTEGLLLLANDIAAEKAKTSLKSYFKARPEVEDYAKFLDRGGNKDEYFKRQSTAWSNVKFDDKDEAVMTSAIVADLMQTGMSKEQAEQTAKLYKDTDKLKEFGKAAHTRLVTGEQTRKQQEELNYNTEVAKEAKFWEDHWNNVNEIVKKGTLNNITIPETDREGFFAYVAFAADDNGNSKATLERQKMPVEMQLQLDYLAYKKFDLKTLISNAVKTEQVKSLRTRVTTQSGVSGGEGVDKSKFVKNENADKIDINSVLG